MTITIRQKALANDNISLYLDIYDGGKRKFEFLSLYLLPEVDAETKARNEETLQRAHQIRAERILHPETIPEVGHLMIVKEIPNDESPEVLDWIQTYIDWMSDNTDYSKAIVDQSKYLKYLMSEFLANKRRPHITLRKFDKEWFKAFFLCTFDINFNGSSFSAYPFTFRNHRKASYDISSCPLATPHSYAVHQEVTNPEAD